MQITVSAAHDDVQINMSVDEAEELMEVLEMIPEDPDPLTDPVTKLYEILRGELAHP